MIAPVLVVVFVLCAMVPCAFVIGRSVGRVEERHAVSEWLTEAGHATYRSSWIAAAKVVRTYMPEKVPTPVMALAYVISTTELMVRMAAWELKERA